MSISTLLHINPSAASPIWRQIEDGMRRQVVSGRLVEGSAVPSVRELAKALRVNPATVSKAYRRLTDAGLLIVRRGEGTFVAALTGRRRRAEGDQLLEEAAAEFLRKAISVGVDLESAVRAVEEGWQTMKSEGGERTGDER